ncbi:uncharacterized protein LOC128987506 [Macrosteles quadrilineatus]|uniref:uncharacterized protein LOC128987506 n=1 Tax=Macrosteles quadrilineatus TaxID=74068 RepID=UPI0023E215F3|nr:uncharacterized protein LOC128987506 [Macrosteles quadrilineatus]
MLALLLFFWIPLVIVAGDETPKEKNNQKWDRKTRIDENTKYEDHPVDLRMLIDRIDAGDLKYRNKQLTPQARCRGLITVNRNIVPLLIAYNMGKTFKIHGKNDEVAEVKVQTGLYVSRINSIWRQNFRCMTGNSLTLLNSAKPRPVVPLFYK